jgi:hypothetical protein
LLLDYLALLQAFPLKAREFLEAPDIDRSDRRQALAREQTRNMRAQVIGIGLLTVALAVGSTAGAQWLQSWPNYWSISFIVAAVWLAISVFRLR